MTAQSESLSKIFTRNATEVIEGAKEFPSMSKGRQAFTVAVGALTVAGIITLNAPAIFWFGAATFLSLKSYGQDKITEKNESQNTPPAPKGP